MRFHTRCGQKDYWGAIGVKTAVKSEERSLLTQRWNAADFDVAIWAWGRALNPLIEPYFVFPHTRGLNNAPLYGLWYATRGKEGEEPSGDIRKAMELYDKYIVTVDERERTKIGKELIRLSAENAWFIGTIGLLPDIVVVKNDFRNVPEEAPSDWILKTPGNTYPEQYFIKK
ncbi:MAG: hypothetical protein ACUVXI_20070 [bacterium]